MPIDPSVLAVQPGADRDAAAAPDPVSLISLDLATPDTAPDEWQRAAARRVSAALKVPDPDGRVWRADKGPFATGRDYLGFMRGMVQSGDVWEYAATPELKAFEAADDAGRLALARKARPALDAAGQAAARLIAPEGYGLPDEALSDAPAEARAANARLRADAEERRRYNRGQTAQAEPFTPSRDAASAEADRAAVDAWRTRRDEAALVAEHREKLLGQNLWAVWLAVSPSLSDKGREIAAAAFKDRRLAGSDIADFQRLPEKEQAVVAKLARLSRNPEAGTLLNTLGDAGIGFLNGLVQTPANAAKQVDTLTTSVDRLVFGPEAGLLDAEEINRRARTEQRLAEALDDAPGLDASGADHGYVARSLIGAASTLPYMAYASTGAGGAAAVALDFMQRLDDRIAQEGGDVIQDSPEWLARKAVYGALYAGIERVSALPIFKETSDIALKTMFLKLATRHGAAAAEQVALHVGKETFTESLEEAAQRVIEEHAASVGLGRGDGWREAVKGGVAEFAESLGTMGIIAGVGTARQGVQARTLKGRQSLAEFTADTLRREAFLLSDNPFGGQVAVETRLTAYRAAWEKGGAEALRKLPELTGEQADLFGHVFEGERERAAVDNLIAGRNIVANTGDPQAAPLTEAAVRGTVLQAGASAPESLMAQGFTEAGARRVSDFFRQEADLDSRHGEALRQVADILADAWTEGQGERAETAREMAEPLQPLRDLYQRAGTREGAAKAFKELGFSEQQAGRLSDAFHAEHALATSPQAAAAFRAFYLDTSSELTAAERLRRMTGFESEAAPEHGDGAARLTLRDPDGTARGSVLFLPGQTEAFDPEGPHAGEAVEQVTGGAVTAAEWDALAPEQRRDAAARMGIRANGGFEITAEDDPSARADGQQADLLTGRLTLAEGAPTATLYHEATHAWLAVMRHAGKLTAADIRKLQDRYGVAPDDAAWFNEEALADDIREIGAAADFAPDRPLASRFVEAVGRFSGAVRRADAQRKAASGARQALYESIVYGRAFEGGGDFEAAAAKMNAQTQPPTAGASTAAKEPATAPEGGQDAPAADASPRASADTAAAEARPADPRARKPLAWSAATPQGNLRVGGYWAVLPRDRFISDTDPRYDGTLQGRTRDATVSSAEQVAGIAAQGTFDPLRLLDSPDTANGAPVAVPVTLKNAEGKDEQFYMVLSGNGRFRALDAVDADNRGDEYRKPVQAFADERGIPYDPADMTAAAHPRLVRLANKKPANTTWQQVASLSNQNAVLQMSDAEQAAADAELIERDGTAALFNGNKDGLPSKTGSDEFFAWFVRATGDASLADSKGNPTDTARTRARRAMLALAVGKGPRGKATVAAFTENAEALGLDRQRDALLMASGALSALEERKPAYALSEELSRAAADLLRIAADRKAGKTADAQSVIGQGDMLDPMPAAAAEALRLLDSKRPAEGIAEAFRRYADLAAKIDTDTPDMFGEPPAAKDTLLRQAAADTESGTRYSLSVAPAQDADYLAAVQRGDMEAAQAMVAAAAKAAGYTVGKVYHGTKEAFTVFDRDAIGNATDNGFLGRGFYFTTDAVYATQYAGAGGRVIEAYLKAEQPYPIEKDELNRMIAAADADDVDALDDFTRELTGNDYDSVIYDDQVMVLNPEQVKSAEPVTRDDAGNVIPLSQRFNPRTPDIRYSLTVSPTLSEDIAAALNTDPAAGTMKRRQEIITLSNLPPLLRFLEIPDADIVIRTRTVRKIQADHLLEVGQIAELPQRYAAPAAVFRDGSGLIILTDAHAMNKDGQKKPVMVYLRPAEEQGKRNIIASAYPGDATKEAHYVQLAKTPGAFLYYDKEKAAGISLEEGTNSTLGPLAAGGLSKTPEAFNAWLHVPESEDNVAQAEEPVNAPVRYALDLTGRAYGEDKKHILTGFMAHAALTGASFPSPRTVARIAADIGVDSFDYDALAAGARRLAAETEDEAIRKAAASADPAKAAYAVGELARRSARALVRSGAREGERLAQSADRIRGLSEDGVRRAMAAVTGADYADIETDTDIDVAASLLSADPKKFQPEEERKRAAAVGAAAGAEGESEEEPQAFPETDEDAPELTDRQRADIARKRREREARIQGYLDAARKRGAKSRFRDEERRNRKAANDKADAEERAAAGEGAQGGDGAGAGGSTPEADGASDAFPVDFTDRWEAAAFLRVWAFDRFRRDNPNRDGRDIAKNKVAVEFYRKTAVRELSALASKLLEPGAPRESVVRLLGDIAPQLSANQIERRTAFIFGLLNRHAVREERRALVKKFKAELKRQFVKGAAFEELGVDLGRTLTGAVEEDARYVLRVCELSDRALDGETSALQEERARLNAVLAERGAMTAEDGTPLPAGDDDMQTRKALRQLALLDKFGGMVDMMPGEILDLTGAGLADFAQEALALRERWQAYDELVEAIRGPLAAAIARGETDPQAEETAAGAVADSLTGMLRLRLDFLTRYADPAKREAGRAAVSDFMDLLARGNTDYAVALQEDEAALNRALGQIFTRPDGRPDRRRIRAWMDRLDERIPAELAAQLTRQGHQESMTYGQMLQLLASLDQWASYRDNIARHDRKGQAALIRSFVFEDPATGETRRALTNEDTLVLEWLRRGFYADKRGAITAITRRIAGRTVDSPDPLYMPVRMQLDKKAALHVGQGAWQPLAGVFSRRVRNKLDFDETASILDVFRDRSRETALLTAFSERGMILREVLTSRAFQDAVRRFHGPAALTRILKQVEQTLNGGRPRTQTDAQAAAAALAMRVTTYTGLGWNLASAAKQTVSLPVFANAIGFRKLGQILLSPPDRDVIRRLRESDEYRVRYGTGPASGMDIATRAAYESPQDSAFKRFFADWGLWANRKVDWVISAWVGQGVYRDLYAKYLDQGMDEAEADRRAVSETFSLIEETQQSGRTENATALTREHGLLGKLLTQFATSPLQQMQYEIVSFREWRDLAANGGPEENIRDARNRFMRSLAINHVIVPGLMAGITGLYKAATGDEPDWKKDGFWWTLLISAIMGQFSRILFAGAFAEQTLRVLFLREPPRMGQLVPAEGAIRFAANLAYPVRDIATWDTEHLRGDLIRALKSTAFTRLPVSVYENLTEK